MEICLPPPPIPDSINNAPGFKTWQLSEWVQAGGNSPNDHQFGVVVRLRGYDEPGKGSTGDTVYLAVCYVNSSTSKIYYGFQSVRGSKTIPWCG